MFENCAHKDVTTANQLLVLLPEFDNRIQQVKESYQNFPGNCVGCRIARRHFIKNVRAEEECYCAAEICDE